MLALDTVYHMKAEELLAALPDSTIDLIVTSPPYDNLRTYKGFGWDFELIAKESYRVLTPGGVLVWVVGDATVNGSETLTSMRQALYFVDVTGFRMHDTMVYQKDAYAFPDVSRYYQVWEYMFVLSKGAPRTTNLARVKTTHLNNSASTKRKADGSLHRAAYKTGNETRVLENVWKFGVGNGKSTLDKIAFEHPATFPEPLAERHVLTWSKPGDTVLDYFGGSGTTAKMARQNGRRYLTCDISAEYVELMQKRLAQPFTVPMFAEQPIEQPKPTQNGLFDAIEGDKE